MIASNNEAVQAMMIRVGSGGQAVSEKIPVAYFLTLQSLSALNNPDQHRNDGEYQKDVNKIAHRIDRSPSPTATERSI
jgi:hypothetical protein